MYKGTNQGSVANSRGRLFRFGPGTLIDEPKGSLDHCQYLEWVEKREVKNEPETKESVKPKKGSKKSK